VTTGHLTDPHDEFMIKELKSLHRAVLDQDYVDEYWERKYTLKDLSMGNSSSVGMLPARIQIRPS
jgi:gamma-tubulin complex component 2